LPITTRDLPVDSLTLSVATEHKKEGDVIRDHNPAGSNNDGLIQMPWNRIVWPDRKRPGGSGGNFYRFSENLQKYGRVVSGVV